MSQRGIRKGDPLSPLLSALTLQAVLERADTACVEAALVGFFGDFDSVGNLGPHVGECRRPCMDHDVGSTGLEPCASQCGHASMAPCIYDGGKVPVAAEAAKQRITHRLHRSWHASRVGRIRLQSHGAAYSDR